MMRQRCAMIARVRLRVHGDRRGIAALREQDLQFTVVQPKLMYPGSDEEDLPLALQAIFRNDVKQ